MLFLFHFLVDIFLLFARDAEKEEEGVKKMMAKNKSCLKILGKAMAGEKKKRGKKKKKKPLQFSFESGPSPFCWLVPRFFQFSFQLFASQTSIVTEQQGKGFDKLSAWVSILKQKREKKTRRFLVRREKNRPLERRRRGDRKQR
jgi:hypothetical protein